MEELNGMLYFSPENPNSSLTVKDREKVSFPTRLLFQKKKIIGKVLDLGCGLGKDVDFLKSKSIDIIGFDPYYFTERPKGKFDTILCNYVLNVLLPREQMPVLMLIAELLKPSGTAFFTVRRDLKREGFRTHYVHKKQTYQTNVILPYKTFLINDFCQIYEYKHFNQYQYQNRKCPFCHPTRKWELITESSTAYALYDIFPKSKGHSLIIPKKHNENYFLLTERLKEDCWIMVDRVKRILENNFNPSGFNIKINIGKSAGQKINHTVIHIIPRY